MLARFRPNPDLADLVTEEWDDQGWMRVGNVPRSWRKSRQAARARLISQWAWNERDDSGAPAFAGIRYLSKLDTEFELWAIFGDVQTRVIEQQAPDPNDPELRRILGRYNLTLH